QQRRHSHGLIRRDGRGRCARVVATLLMTALPTLELADIQGLVARGYPDLTAASYVLLSIDTPSRAGAWLTQIAAEVAPAPAHPPEYALNIALGASGLTKLGVSEPVMEAFSNEF